ncbi:MAG: hypothetical protein CVU44_06420 [Chloroflexi bacterium HGW-Chloroflexi-6]|nr:MAG: hypothetical protein CVU44_06420 [Chloroflexi bacterium HGW-Chloroflexi-6]
MLDGLAFLIVIYGLTIFLTAIGNFRRMREINRNSKSVLGVVVETSSTRNILAGPFGGTAYRTMIHYKPDDAREPYQIYLRDHNLLMTKTYSMGDTVEVVYDRDAHYRSYPKPEWQSTLRDFWSCAFCLALAALLAAISRLVQIIY